MNVVKKSHLAILLFFAIWGNLCIPTSNAQQLFNMPKSDGLKNAPSFQGSQKIVLPRSIGIQEVRQLAFSPDSSMLAIYATSNPGKANIFIYETRTWQKVNAIISEKDYGTGSIFLLQWLQDNLTITFGLKYRWNAKTAMRLDDSPIRGINAKLNKDGTKIITIDSAQATDFVHLYDTTTWAEKIIYPENLISVSAAWTDGNNIIIGVAVPRASIGKTIGDFKITNIDDQALVLYSLKNSRLIFSKWFPAKIETIEGKSKTTKTGSILVGQSNFISNTILVANNHVVVGGNLEYKEFYPGGDDNGPGGGGFAFSFDGKYLFIKDRNRINTSRPVSNAIVSLEDGKLISRFPGGDNGIAASSDGCFLAIGDHDSFQILKINSKAE